MKISSVLFLGCLVLLASASWVQKLSDTNHLTQVLQPTKDVWLVLEAKQSDLVLEKVAEIFKGMIKIGFIKGDGQPQIRLYNDNRQNPISYDGAIQSGPIVEFILNNLDKIVQARSEVARALKANQQFQQKEAQRAKKEWDQEQELRKKSDVILLNTENWNTFTNGREPWIINFYQANNSACIDLNKDWELIATQFKGQVKVAKINITEAGNHKLEEQIQLQKYPSVRFYNAGPKTVSEFVQFEGTHRRFSIQQWLREKLNQKTQTVDIPRLNAQNYANLCKSTKNTCVIVFLEEETPETLKKIEELSLKNLKKPITFMISKKGQQDKFAEQAGVTSYPDTVMMYCKHKKTWRMEGLDFTAIDDAIGEISLGNRNNFQKYKWVEQIQ